MKTLRFNLLFLAFMGLLNVGAACDAPKPKVEGSPEEPQSEVPDDETPIPEPAGPDVAAPEPAEPLKPAPPTIIIPAPKPAPKSHSQIYERELQNFDMLLEAIGVSLDLESVFHKRAFRVFNKLLEEVGKKPLNILEHHSRVFRIFDELLKQLGIDPKREDLFQKRTLDFFDSLLSEIPAIDKPTKQPAPTPKEPTRPRLDDELDEEISDQKFVFVKKYDFAYDAQYLPQKGVDSEKTRPLQFAIGYEKESDGDEYIILVAPLMNNNSRIKSLLFKHSGPDPKLPISELTDIKIIPNKIINGLPIIDSTKEEALYYLSDILMFIDEEEPLWGITKFYPRVFKIFDELLKQAGVKTKPKPVTKKPFDITKDLPKKTKLKPVSERKIQEKKLTEKEKKQKAILERLKEIRQAADGNDDEEEDDWDDDDEDSDEEEPESQASVKKEPATKPKTAAPKKDEQPQTKKPVLKPQPKDKPLPIIKPAKKPKKEKPPEKATEKPKSKLQKLRDFWEKQRR